MSTEDNTSWKNFKFKITTKGMRAASEDKSQGNMVKIFVNNGQRDRATGCENRRSEVNVLVKPSIPANSSKRRPEMSLDSQTGKKRKMDRKVKLQCANILKELMKHPVGWVFNEPVDPVKLKIPDYFSVIAVPMDLGTIKRKLEGSMYFSAEEFAADVRLTFSNAVLYNPPGHEVHNWAKILDGHFSRRWKSLDANMKHEKNIEQASSVDRFEKKGQDAKQNVGKNCQDTKPVGLNKAPMRIKLTTYRPMSSEEKWKFRLELLKVLNRKIMGNLWTVFQKFGLTGLDEERLDSYIGSTDDETLWKLRREIKVILDARDGKVEPARMAQNRLPLLGKTDQKERCSPSACASADHRQSIDSTAAKCSSCGRLTCHCRLKSGSAQASSSDISSERSSEHDHCGDSKLDCEVKYPLAFRTSSFGLDSDGPGVVLNEENSPHLSTPASTAAYGEGWTAFNVQMSPNKALRAAMLKSRFADTIFRATHQTLLDHGEKSDPVRIQQERERLEREQLEEKARIEAEIKAAEAASRRRALDDLKMRRERERSAARMALQNMEKTVEIDENLEILKDLEMLCCGSPSDLPEGVKGVHPGNALERLGLYIKDDYLEEDEDPILDGEEGEILS